MYHAFFTRKELWGNGNIYLCIPITNIGKIYVKLNTYIKYIFETNT